MSKNKIRSIPTEQDKMTGNVQAMKRALPGMIEYLQMKAECMRAYYDALIEQGFTPDEALHLTGKYSADSSD